MASIDRRIQDLERLYATAPPEDEGAKRRRTITSSILDEFGRLKASRAVHYRAGVRIEPENIPGRILGPGYTTGELWELAIRRALERERETAPNGLSAEDLEEMVQGWTEAFRKFTEDRGHDWNKVEAPAGE